MKNLIIVLCLIFAIGCNTKVTKTEPIPNDIVPIVEAMKDVDKVDCIKYYKQMSGIRDYMVASGYGIINTADILKVGSELQKVYPKSKEYPNYKIAINNFMVDRGYDIKKDIVTNVTNVDTQISKDKVILDFDLLTRATKIALDSKE